jgi:hypothetical protein
MYNLYSNSIELLNDNHNKVNMYNLYSNSMELLNDNLDKIELYNLYSNLIELLNTIGIKLICIIYIQIQWNY